MEIRRAVLLAAGRGTRMRELTNDLPKPMIAVRGKPILQHIVEGLRGVGIENILIVVGYRAEVVKNFFEDGSKFRTKISYTTQVIQDGTGRVVELGRSFAGSEPFVLHYGDILVDHQNYESLVSLGGSEAIVSVKRNEDVSKGGAIFIDQKWIVTDVREKPAPGEPTSPWYNAGVYAFRPSIFDYTAKLQPSPRGEYELTDAIRELAIATGKVRALELNGAWADVRDPEVLAELNK